MAPVKDKFTDTVKGKLGKVDYSVSYSASPAALFVPAGYGAEKDRPQGTQSSDCP